MTAGTSGLIVPYERVFYRGRSQDVLGIVFPEKVQFETLTIVADNFRDFPIPAQIERWRYRGRLPTLRSG